MTGFARELAARIGHQGPVPLAEVMAQAVHAYYDARDPLGATGDFITAPEISQVFGELIGLWCAVAWDKLDRPQPCMLVECGPGRGTLMADALRAVAGVKPFADSIEVHLVEQSATLRDRQRAMLGKHDPQWHRDLASVPARPLIVVANEFLDALPIRQLVRGPSGWQDRHVGLGADGNFVFVERPAPDVPASDLDGPVGSVKERSIAAESFVEDLAARLVRDGGAALLIDYGYIGPALGDTLQAVKDHAYHPVLATLGEADLTAHVDFGTLAQVARAAGAKVHGPTPQGTWLSRLGIHLRTTQLTRGRPAAEAARIAGAVRRLVAPDGMGLLFKVMALSHPRVPDLDGFMPTDGE
jgi:NADH dehydrogenase [ubiquinone] 1 alpha subcomplex assembly factor 7